MYWKTSSSASKNSLTRSKYRKKQPQASSMNNDVNDSLDESKEEVGVDNEGFANIKRKHEGAIKHSIPERDIHPRGMQSAPGRLTDSPKPTKETKEEHLDRLLELLELLSEQPDLITIDLIGETLRCSTYFPEFTGIQFALASIFQKFIKEKYSQEDVAERLDFILDYVKTFLDDDNMDET